MVPAAANVIVKPLMRLTLHDFIRKLTDALRPGKLMVCRLKKVLLLFNCVDCNGITSKNAGVKIELHPRIFIALTG